MIRMGWNRKSGLRLLSSWRNSGIRLKRNRSRWRRKEIEYRRSSKNLRQLCWPKLNRITNLPAGVSRWQVVTLVWRRNLLKWLNFKVNRVLLLQKRVLAGRHFKKRIFQKSLACRKPLIRIWLESLISWLLKRIVSWQDLNKNKLESKINEPNFKKLRIVSSP